MRRLITSIIIAVVVLIGMAFGLSFYLSPDDLAECLTEKTCKKADVIVVVSGGDTEARVEEGVNLFSIGIADYVVFSGAAADENSPSNAEVMKEEAIMAGVPAERIITETRSKNTKENASGVAVLVERYEFESMVLVTSSYHQRRAYLEFRKVLPESVVIYNHPTTLDGTWNQLWWLTPVGWWIALKEIVGIGLFYVS